MPRRALVLAVMLLEAGCATAHRPTRSFAMQEHLCVHGNCLMPAGIDPRAMCLVCKCKKKARECVR